MLSNISLPSYIPLFSILRIWILTVLDFTNAHSFLLGFTLMKIQCKIRGKSVFLAFIKFARVLWTFKIFRQTEWRKPTYLAKSRKWFNIFFRFYSKISLVNAIRWTFWKALQYGQRQIIRQFFNKNFRTPLHFLKFSKSSISIGNNWRHTNTKYTKVFKKMHLYLCVANSHQY